MADGARQAPTHDSDTPWPVRAYRRLQDITLPERWLIRRFIAQHLPAAEGLCLDIGGGNAPYRDTLMAGRPGCRYLIVDLVVGDSTDLQADVHRLPLADGCAEVVMLFHVIQHLSAPATALAECRRVLKPQGSLVIVYPFLTCQGRSQDLRRWTMSGMEKDLGLAGFDPVAHEIQGGSLLFAMSLLAELPGRLLIAHRKGWRAGRSPLDAIRLALSFVLALPFRLLGFPALLADRLLGPPSHYIGGMILARRRD